MAAIDKEIGIAPAYDTRRMDGVYYPWTQTFQKAYEIVDYPFLPSKTKEVIFQILNRTIWTNNKAFKSGKQDLPDCTRCGQPETMEHLIYNCEEYSVAIWDEVGQTLTHALVAHTGDEIPRINLTPLEIIYNATHPLVKIHAKEKTTQQAICHLIQEVKRDIIYRRMNTPANHRMLNLTRVRAHLLTVIKKIISLYEYQGTRNHQEIIDFLKLYEQKIYDRV
jgi:hypothetical protein